MVRCCLCLSIHIKFHRLDTDKLKFGFLKKPIRRRVSGLLKNHEIAQFAYSCYNNFILDFIVDWTD